MTAEMSDSEMGAVNATKSKMETAIAELVEPYRERIRELTKNYDASLKEVEQEIRVLRGESDHWKNEAERLLTQVRDIGRLNRQIAELTLERDNAICGERFAVEARREAQLAFERQMLRAAEAERGRDAAIAELRSLVDFVAGLKAGRGVKT